MVYWAFTKNTLPKIMLPQLPRELWMMILAIKHREFLKDSSCVCGCEDYKHCGSMALCADLQCNTAHCWYQEGIYKWMWECNYCFRLYCGLHPYNYNTEHDTKKCLECGKSLYKKYRPKHTPNSFYLDTLPIRLQNYY